MNSNRFQPGKGEEEACQKAAKRLRLVASLKKRREDLLAVLVRDLDVLRHLKREQRRAECLREADAIVYGTGSGPRPAAPA